jgi:hypothetical protein
MTLRGKAAVAIWSDMRDPIAHDLWHSREHLPERIGISGFLRARRYVSTDGGKEPRYFVLYELSDASVLTSPHYLACLNDPTPWTRETMRAVNSLSRTLCCVALSLGTGQGGCAATLRFSPPQEEILLQTWLQEHALPALAVHTGVTGVHWLRRDESVERPDTTERRLRVTEDGFVDWVVFVEGYDADAVRAAIEMNLPPSTLAGRGASNIVHSSYWLALSMDEADRD